MHNLLSKDIVILIVEPVSSIRNTMRKVFSEFGYTEIMTAENPQEAFTLMFGNRVDLIFCGLFPTENVTGVHLLRAAVELPEYRHLRFSVLINEEDLVYLPFLYSLGLFSYHLKPMTYDSLWRDVTILTEKLENIDDEYQLAASGLRGYLEEVKDFKTMASLEGGLYESMDTSPEQLARYISSLFKSENKLRATTMLYSHWGRDAEVDRMLEPIMLEHVGVSDLSAVGVDSLVQTCIVVDTDDATSLQVKNVLTSMGVNEVITVDSAKEACELLQQRKDIDLVITEWKLRSMDGDEFVQNVRDNGHPITPIIIYSSLVPTGHRAFFNEIGQIEVVEKPCQESQLKSKIEEILKKFRFPNSSQDYEEKIRALLASGDEEGARSLFKTYKKLKTATPASVLLMEAFFDFNSGNSEMARNKILKLTQYGALNHIGLSLLGKVLLKLGDFQEALKVMETANKMAPSTIDRLCDMADVYGGLGQESLLDNVIDKLKTSGSDLSRSNKTLAKHETARGNTEEAAKYIGANEEVASGVVAHMNNLGVAYAQASDLEASAKSYVDGLKTIIGKFPKLEALVQYNLALNLVRQGKLDKSMKILRSTVAKADGHLKVKAFSLYKKVKHSIETKQPLNIAVSNKPVNLGDSLGEAVRDELKGLSKVGLADTGEVALFGVFKVKYDKTNNNFMEKFPNAVQKKLEKLGEY